MSRDRLLDKIRTESTPNSQSSQREVRLPPDFTTKFARHARLSASRLRLPEIALRSYSVDAATSSRFLARLPSRHAPAPLTQTPRIARHELAATNRSDRFQAIDVGRLRRSAGRRARPANLGIKPRSVCWHTDEPSVALNGEGASFDCATAVWLGGATVSDATRVRQ